MLNWDPKTVALNHLISVCCEVRLLPSGSGFDSAFVFAPCPCPVLHTLVTIGKLIFHNLTEHYRVASSLFFRVKWAQKN